MSDDEISIGGGLFEEPEDFRPPPPQAHFTKYERNYATNETNHGINEINLRLVGKSPLWGHLLWNAGVYTANFIEKNSETYVKDKKVVELGAASALPSMLCALNGAAKVIATDYPDPDLLENIEYNINALGYDKAKDIIDVVGYIWGHSVAEVSARLAGVAVDENGEVDESLVKGDAGKADFIIMSDLVFNHSEHEGLFKSCKRLIKPLKNGEPRSGGKCLVVFSPHRPHLVDRDLQFFTDAKELHGFDVEQIEMIHWDHPMFPEEPAETEEIRRRMYCYILHPTW